MPDGSRSFQPRDSQNLRRIAELYREHGRYIGRVIRRCGVPDAELEDAVQETFLVAYRRLDDFEGRASARTWLYAIAVRVASTIRRSQHRERARREKAGDRMHGRLEIDPEAELSRAEAADRLDQILDELDDAKRTVFVLAELEGVKAREISEILNLNVRTVHSRLRLARQKFESAVERHHAQERGRMQRAHLRALAEHAEPERPPRRAALAAIMVRIERGDAPTLVGWEQLAIGSGSGASFLLPMLATVAIGGSGLAIVAATSEPDPTPRAAVPLPDPTPAPHEPRVVPPQPAIPAPPEPKPKVQTSPQPIQPATTPRRPERKVVPAEPSAETGIEAELRLVEKARLALRNHDANAALRALDEHARRFPNGQLATERGHTKIKAYCLAGRTDEADALATDATARRIFVVACNVK